MGPRFDHLADDEITTHAAKDVCVNGTELVKPGQQINHMASSVTRCIHKVRRDPAGEICLTPVQ